MAHHKTVHCSYVFQVQHVTKSPFNADRSLANVLLLVNMLIIQQHINRAATVPVPSITVYVTVRRARGLLSVCRCLI